VATSVTGIAPARRIVGVGPVQSTIVEAGPPGPGPPSRVRSTESPSWSRIAAASEASAIPDTLADVVGNAPTPAARARGAGWSGTRRPIVGAPPVRTAGHGTSGRCGTMTVRPPGQNAAASADAAGVIAPAVAARAGTARRHRKPRH